MKSIKCTKNIKFFMLNFRMQFYLKSLYAFQFYAALVWLENFDSLSPFLFFFISLFLFHYLSSRQFQPTHTCTHENSMYVNLYATLHLTISLVENNWWGEITPRRTFSLFWVVLLQTGFYPYSESLEFSFYWKKRECRSLYYKFPLYYNYKNKNWIFLSN